MSPLDEINEKLESQHKACLVGIELYATNLFFRRQTNMLLAHWSHTGKWSDRWSYRWKEILAGASPWKHIIAVREGQGENLSIKMCGQVRALITSSPFMPILKRWGIDWNSYELSQHPS